MAAVTKTSKLLSKFRAGKKLTANQIMSQCGFTSVNAVYGTISSLREDGYRIINGQSREGLTQYSLK